MRKRPLARRSLMVSSGMRRRSSVARARELSTGTSFQARSIASSRLRAWLTRPPSPQCDPAIISATIRGGTTMPKITGARLFAEMMRGYEVSHIFFVPAFMLKAFAEMEDMPIRRVMVHGEKAAAYMADGYARASGKPGVCMAQMIGASNLAAGLRDGFMAGAPILAITGGPSPQSRYRHAYQEVDDITQFDAVRSST